MENQQLPNNQDKPKRTTLTQSKLLEASSNKKSYFWIVSIMTILAVSLSACLIVINQQSSGRNTALQGTAEVSEQPTQTSESIRAIAPSLRPTVTQPLSFGSLASITVILTFSSPPSASPADLLVTDPVSRRTGVDPRTSVIYDEIPEGFYDVEEYAGRGDQGGVFPPEKVFTLSDPLDGSYAIQVIGTGSGDYTLDILGYDKLGDPTEATVSGQIEVDSVDRYRMEYSSAPGSSMVVTNIEAGNEIP